MKYNLFKSTSVGCIGTSRAVLYFLSLLELLQRRVTISSNVDSSNAAVIKKRKKEVILIPHMENKSFDLKYVVILCRSLYLYLKVPMIIVINENPVLHILIERVFCFFIITWVLL